MNYKRMVQGLALTVCLDFDAWQHLKAYHHFVEHEQRFASWKLEEDAKKSVVYRHDQLLKTWLKDAQHEDCEVIKIHPWYRDASIPHFSLQLRGEYVQLLHWLSRVEHDLPALRWEKLSLSRGDGVKLDMAVECYASH